MDRIVKGTAGTISVTLYVDGAATDPSPDSATLGIVRDDGTVLVAPATATVNTGTGIFSYTLTPTHTASLDVLTVTWTYTLGALVQTVKTFVEIVGGHVCTLAQIDEALNKGGTASEYDLADKQAARDAATVAFEQEAGVAFTPRYRRETLDGTGSDDLLLSTPRPLGVVSGSVSDTALTAPELAGLEVDSTGLIYRAAGWGTGRRTITLSYEHGHRTPPADVSHAVATLAASLLKDGPFDDRGFGVTDEGGAVRLLTAGISGAAFSIPAVQSALARYRYPVVA